ncbi:MAG TPA: 2-C-methyl-D-erythritol 2,4-cyclodiphosphate synthase, partial [Desulfobaccales bacterium]|nr:2-C-methyl-D-erythritol 2,4-cyclodiphosphate synthase [Desulfobaccales bacterium]
MTCCLPRPFFPCAGGRKVRVGLGYDAHRLAAGRQLILGGVEIPTTLPTLDELLGANGCRPRDFTNLVLSRLVPDR